MLLALCESVWRIKKRLKPVIWFQMPLNVSIPVQRSSNVEGLVREGATSTKEIVSIFPGRQKMFLHWHTSSKMERHVGVMPKKIKTTMHGRFTPRGI